MSSDEDEPQASKKKRIPRLLDEEESSEGEELGRRRKRLAPISSAESSSDESAAGSVGYESDGQSEKCPICLNRLLSQRLASPDSCSHHIFCLECLQEWSKTINTCPVDRSSFQMIQVLGEDGKVEKEIPAEVKEPSARDMEEIEVEVVSVDQTDFIYSTDRVVCEVCHRGDREETLLLCDSCDLGFHCECLQPPLVSIPLGEWFCRLCRQVLHSDDESSNLSSPISLPPRRIIARTRASEAVRSRIQHLRAITNRENVPAPTSRIIRKKKKRKKKPRRCRRENLERLSGGRSRRSRASNRPLRPPSSHGGARLLASRFSQDGASSHRLGPSFSLFGASNALMDFEEDYQEEERGGEEGSEVMVSRPLLRNWPPAPLKIAPRVVLNRVSDDLLSSLLAQQDALLRRSRDMVVLTSGQLVLRTAPGHPPESSDSDQGSPPQDDNPQQSSSPVQGEDSDANHAPSDASGSSDGGQNSDDDEAPKNNIISDSSDKDARDEDEEEEDERKNYSNESESDNPTSPYSGDNAITRAANKRGSNSPSQASGSEKDASFADSPRNSSDKEDSDAESTKADRNSKVQSPRSDVESNNSDVEHSEPGSPKESEAGSHRSDDSSKESDAESAKEENVSEAGSVRDEGSEKEFSEPGSPKEAQSECGSTKDDDDSGKEDAEPRKHGFNHKDDSSESEENTEVKEDISEAGSGKEEEDSDAGSGKEDEELSKAAVGRKDGDHSDEESKKDEKSDTSMEQQAKDSSSKSESDALNISSEVEELYPKSEVSQEESKTSQSSLPEEKADEQPAEEEVEDFTDLAPKINISLLPKIPKKKKNSSSFLSSDKELERKSVLEFREHSPEQPYWKSNSYQGSNRWSGSFRGGGSEGNERWSGKEDKDRWSKGERNESRWSKGDRNEKWSKGEGNDRSSSKSDDRNDRWSKSESNDRWSKGEGNDRRSSKRDDNDRWSSKRDDDRWSSKRDDDRWSKDKNERWSSKGESKSRSEDCQKPKERDNWNKEKPAPEPVFRTDPERPLWDVDYAKRARIKKTNDERNALLKIMEPKVSPGQTANEAYKSPPRTSKASRGADKNNDFFRDSKPSRRPDRSSHKRTRPHGDGASESLFKKLKVEAAPSPESAHSDNDMGAADFGGADAPASSDDEQPSPEAPLAPYDPCDPTASPVPSPSSVTPPDLCIPDWEEEQKKAAPVQLPDLTMPPPNFPASWASMPFPFPPGYPPPPATFSQQQQAPADSSIQVVDMELESPPLEDTQDVAVAAPTIAAPPPAAPPAQVPKAAAPIGVFDALLGNKPSKTPAAAPPTAAPKNNLKNSAKPSKHKHQSQAKPKSQQSTSQKGMVHTMKNEGFKIEDVHLKILDDLPSSAVEMQVKEKFLKKLNRQERVVEEVKLILKPFYTGKTIDKDEYKEILRKAVPKICKNRAGDINPKKIKVLIEGYIKKIHHERSKATSS